MTGKIFVNYRRDDVAGDARGIHEGLAERYGRSNVFLDVDNLLAGQRFDKELEKALKTCDMLIAVIGPRWMDLLAAKAQSGDRDYVREEIAAALQRGIVVIPVRVGQEGRMAPLPSRESLPPDIRDLVLHQRHDVGHERFRRDIADLIAAIDKLRGMQRPNMPRRVALATAAVAILAGAAVAIFATVGFNRLPVVARPDADRGGSPPQPPAQAAPSPQAACDSVWVSGGHDRCIVPGSGQTFKDCPECPEMLVVPAGSFVMGSPLSERGREHEAWQIGTESPLHEVRVAHPFAVGKFAVTRGEFEAFVRATGHNPGDKCWILDAKKNEELAGHSFRDPGFAQADNHTAVCVSWADAQAYAEWLNQKIGKKEAYRVLTEAEREYVARAGTSTPFWWGSSISTMQANYNGYVSYAGEAQGEWRLKTVPVNSFEPNPWGLYQVHGNVLEMVEDCWHTTYQGAPADASAWTAVNCTSHVLRGGSWGSAPWDLRAAAVGIGDSTGRGNLIRFRVARSLNP